MRFVDFAYGEIAERMMKGHAYSPILMTLVIATIPERVPIRQEERYRPLVNHLPQNPIDTSHMPV